jgi:glycosyltransferase involved in cell wall biosynthesis
MSRVYASILPKKLERKTCSAFEYGHNRSGETKLCPDQVFSVIHLVDPAAGHLWGKARVILWLMEAQRASKLIEPMLVTFTPSRLSAMAADYGFRVLNLDTSPSRFSLTAIRTLQAFLKKCTQPVLHTHGYKPNIVGRLVNLVGGPASGVISTCHGWVEDSFALKFYNALDRSTSFLSDRMVVPAPNMIERLPAYRNATVIPNGIPGRCVPSAEEKREAKRNFGWREDQFVVGMLARITKPKGVLEFEQAVSLCDKANIVWVVAGAEANGGAQLVGQSSSAQFVGYINRPSDYLAALDVFVQASYSEGLSLSLLEAARAALPIVATNVGATECAFRDGKEALLIPARDPKRLAESIAMLYDDRCLAQRLGEAARSRFEECYQIERMSEAYLRLYRSVLGSAD